MKQTIYILILVLGLWSCNNKTTEKTFDNNTVDTLKTLLADKQPQNIYIKDKSQYDQTFIDGLSEYHEPIRLIDNFMLIGSDTTYFPDDLALDKKTTFTASKDNNKFLLTVTRSNLTNINYEFQLLDKDNSIIDSKSGVAILASGFFLAPEGEDDPETGDSFFSNEYRIDNEKVWIVIKIGMDKNYEGKKRAKIIYGHVVNSKMTEPVTESPILRIE